MSRYYEPRADAFDVNGDPLSGAKLYFYASGTTTPQTTYSDSALSVANANPVVADSAGRFGDIYLSPAVAYKAVMKTSGDSTVWTTDPVYAPVSTGNVAGLAGLITATHLTNDASALQAITDKLAGTVKAATLSSTASDLQAITAKLQILQAGTSAVARTVQTRLREVVSVKDFGATGDGSTDDYAAFALARDYAASLSGSSSFDNTFSSRGCEVLIPRGTYVLSAEIEWGTVALRVRGEGPNTSVIKARSTFTGDAVFTFGSDSNTATATRTQSLMGVGFNMNDKAIPAIRLFGLRDGGTVKDVMITAFTGTAFLTDWAGNGSSVMNQGITIQDVHAITQGRIANVSVFKLDGLFESALLNCKALGFGNIDNGSAIGFHVGSRTSMSRSARGINIIGCSAGNLKPTVLTGNSNGLLVEAAEYIFSRGCTWEGIDGYAVRYGTASASPAYCLSEDRFYNAGSDTCLLAVRMYSGSHHRATVNITSSSLTDFVKIDSTASTCTVEVTSNQEPDAVNVSVAGATNRIHGLGAGRAFQRFGGSAYHTRMQDGMFCTDRIEITDDTAVTVYTMPDMDSADHALMLFTSSSSSVNGVCQVVGVAGGVPTSLAVGSNVNFVNTAMTGTTGVDGKVTISVPSGTRDVVVENRFGSTITFAFLLVGATDL